MLKELGMEYCELPKLCDVIDGINLAVSRTMVTYLGFIISRIKEEQE